MSVVPLTLRTRLQTTVFQEFIVGVTGLLLVGFIVLHLAGNLLLLGGPEMFNSYADRLHGLGELLWVMRIGLATAFVLHIVAAIRLATLNREKRGQRYAEHHRISQRTVASRFMALSGILLLLFLLLHLYDFTFREKVGSITVVEGLNEGEGLALYGLVWNTFANPLYALIYILAMVMLGMHLTHAASSVFVTLGVLSEGMTRKLENGARIFGAAVAIGFSIIPLYVLVRTYIIGV